MNRRNSGRKKNSHSQELPHSHATIHPEHILEAPEEDRFNFEFFDPKVANAYSAQTLSAFVRRLNKKVPKPTTREYLRRILIQEWIKRHGTHSLPTLLKKQLHIYETQEKNLITPPPPKRKEEQKKSTRPLPLPKEERKIPPSPLPFPIRNKPPVFHQVRERPIEKKNLVVPPPIPPTLRRPTTSTPIPPSQNNNTREEKELKNRIELLERTIKNLDQERKSNTNSPNYPLVPFQTTTNINTRIPNLPNNNNTTSYIQVPPYPYSPTPSALENALNEIVRENQNKEITLLQLQTAITRLAEKQKKYSELAAKDDWRNADRIQQNLVQLEASLDVLKQLESVLSSYQSLPKNLTDTVPQTLQDYTRKLRTQLETMNQDLQPVTNELRQHAIEQQGLWNAAAASGLVRQPLVLKDTPSLNLTSVPKNNFVGI